MPVSGYCLLGCDLLNDIGSLTFCMTEPGTALPLVVVACQNIFSSAPAPSNRQSRISHRSGSLEPSSGPASAAPLVRRTCSPA